MGVKQTLFDARCYIPEEVDITGMFAPNNTSNPVAASNVGDRAGGIWTVTRTGVGLFAVVLTDSYFGPLYSNADMYAPSVTANWVQVVGFNPTNATVGAIAARTLLLQVVNNAGAAVEVGPTTGLLIAWTCGVAQTAIGGR